MKLKQHLIFCILGPIVSMAVLLGLVFLALAVTGLLTIENFVETGRVLGKMVSPAGFIAWLILMTPAFIASCLFTQVLKARTKLTERLWFSGVVFFTFVGVPLALFYTGRNPLTATAAVLATAITVAVCAWLSTPKAPPSPAIHF